MKLKWWARLGSSEDLLRSLGELSNYLEFLFTLGCELLTTSRGGAE
jgi:hypothetical protein